MTYLCTAHCPHCAEPATVWLEASGPVYHGVKEDFEKTCPCWWSAKDFELAEESAKRKLFEGDFTDWRHT